MFLKQNSQCTSEHGLPLGPLRTTKAPWLYSTLRLRLFCSFLSFWLGGAELGSITLCRKCIDSPRSKPRPCVRRTYRLRIIGSPTPGRVCEPCNRRPFRAVRGALESAAGARLRLDPYPIFGPIPPSYYQKMRFLPNPSLLLQPLPN